MRLLSSIISLTLIIFITISCSGPNNADYGQTLYFGVSPSEIPTFKSDLRLASENVGLQFRDTSARTAENRRHLNLGDSADFEQSSISYDEARTVSISMSSRDEKVLVLVANSGLHCGVISLTLVHGRDPTRLDPREGAIIKALSKKWQVIGDGPIYKETEGKEPKC